MYKFCPHCGKAFLEPNEPRSIGFVSQKLGFITWDEIKGWSDNDEASQHFEVGDEITDVLKSGEEIALVVVDKDRFWPGSVQFMLKDCLKDVYSMNEEATNAGGWKASALRKTLNTKILALLPDDMRACIKPRVIDGETDMLWLASEREVFGDQEWVENDPDCGEQFAYYRRPGNRVKGLSKDGSAYHWWERSPRSGSTSRFCCVNSSGYASYYFASASCGVAFGFCI